jgi:ubiquinone/menaquinone biosynthesis C-methylase UbiE
LFLIGSSISLSKISLKLVGAVMEQHFTQIANRYKDLRTTDPEPVEFISNWYKNNQQIVAADVGCGDGRYDKLLFEYLGKRLFLYCLDSNEVMLASLRKYFRTYNILNSSTIVSPAEKIPLLNKQLDSIFTFNAVHHFNLFKFLDEANRVLKKEALLFVYTRTRPQNSRNIWGMYFPMFNRKESRLYNPDELKYKIGKFKSFELIHEEYLRYERESTIELLSDLVRSKHYSTFSLYNKEELSWSVQRFQENLRENYNDENKIFWTDENVMYVVRKIE